MKGNNSFTKNPIFIKNLFDSISKDYDKLNDIMSFGLHRKIKWNIIKKTHVVGLESPIYNYNYDYDCDDNLCSTSGVLTRQLKILDLCTGTGDLAGILAKEYPMSEINGVDFSPEMLKKAKEKNPDITFMEADCTDLPFENGTFDLCVISFGLRNIENLEKALKEIHRVLKPGGIFVNIDLGKPNKFFNLFLKPYMYLWVALLGKIFHGDETPYKYLAQSNESFPSPKELIKLYNSVGFYNSKNENYLFGQIASQISQK